MADTTEIEKVIKSFYPDPTDLVNKEISTFMNLCKNHHPNDQETLRNLVLNFIASNLRVDVPEGDFEVQLKTLFATKANLKKENGSSLNKEIPGFITENILKMPSNRGYIWKDKKYFGKIPTSSKPVVLFEPRKGKTFIHVYEETETKIFEKLKGHKEQRLLKIIKQVTVTKPSLPVRYVAEEKAAKPVLQKTVNKFSALDSGSESDSSIE